MDLHVGYSNMSLIFPDIVTICREQVDTNGGGLGEHDTYTRLETVDLNNSDTEPPLAEPHVEDVSLLWMRRRAKK